MGLCGIMDEPAGVAELVDALDSGSSEHSLWGFKSPLPHLYQHKETYKYMSLFCMKSITQREKSIYALIVCQVFHPKVTSDLYFS